jgi:amino acid adenylation domain-containing protein/non-ribosomal peptide synthase protein (TIGR01720 family)
MEQKKRDIAERFARLPADRQAAFIQALEAQGLQFASLPIVPMPQGQVAPLSYAQQRQWFLWRMDPSSCAYHVAGALRLSGRLEEAALRDSFSALVARHEVLRTVFVPTEDGLARPVVLPAEPLALISIDLSRNPGGTAGGLSAHDAPSSADGDAQDAVDRALRELSQMPFDLTCGPLLRVGVVRLAADVQVLVVVMHHIISDGWSVQLIVDEFAREYRCRVALPATGGAPTDGALERQQAVNHRLGLAEPALRYTDYAAWQRAWLSAGGKDQQLAYWLKHLGHPGADLPTLQLPTDHPRRADARYTSVAFTQALPPALIEAVRARALASGATPFTVLLAAYQALLHRYTGQTDIRVGVPIANRHRPETSRLLGLFVNTQVLRNVIHGTSTLEEVLQATREAVLGAQAHQDLPFEHLVEALQPERSLTQAPLFQVMFNHQRRDMAALQHLPGLKLEDQPLPPSAAQFELVLNLMESAEGQIQASFSYAEALFRPATIQRLASHYLRLLQAFAEDPAQRLCDVVLVGPDEQQALLAWGAGSAWAGSLAPVHQLFEAHAKRSPNATALIIGQTTLTYGGLNQQADRLARHLRAIGVGPETRVGVLMERSAWLVTSLLAVLKAGATYVPMDPAYPAQRLVFMAEDSGIQWLLTHAGLGAWMPAHQRLDVAQWWQEAGTLGDTDSDPDLGLTRPVHGQQLAYIIYTSGSTGRPKGVAVAHAPFSMHCQETATLYDMDERSRELHFLSFSFDGAQERLFTALTCGASLVLRDADLWTPDQTLAALREHQVTHAGFPPAYLQALAADAEPSSAPALQLLSFGGEAMPRAGLSLVGNRLAPRTLINGYGPTEAVVTPMLWKVPAGTDVPCAYAPIGRPVGDRKAMVLDADLALLPPGVPGELYLGGMGLARGYLGRPGLTADRFVADPFDRDGGRLYRTGDLVRWREDGQLEYLGRIDQQLKILGFRIEPGEIEAVLRRQPEVADAAVVAGAGTSGARLLAYVALSPGHSVAAEVLRHRLAAELPEHMVPALLWVLPVLPRTVNGKLDRDALPAPTLVARSEQAEPQGEVEQAIAAVWAELLNVQQVGRHDNFFELGGDSILSLQAVARLRRAGWLLTPRQLFEHQTIARLAPVASTAQPAAPAVGAASTQQRVPATGTVPLLPIQADFFASVSEGRHHWNQAVLLRSEVPLVRSALQEALEAVHDHHDSLRLRYRQDGEGHWTQHYSPVATAERREWLWWRRAASADALRTLCDEVQRSLDLSQGPMWRALGVEMADGTWRLLIVVHHLVVDGVSWRVLLEDLLLAYGQRLAGERCQLPPPTASFQQWAEALRHHAATLEPELAFWRALADVPSTLPCDHPEGDRRLDSLDHLELRLDPVETDRLLKRAPAAFRTQVNDLLLTALGRALCGWSGHARVLVDVEGHGREDEGTGLDVSRTVGWFTSIHPLALDPMGEPGAALKRVKEAIRHTPQRGLGYGLLRWMGSREQRRTLEALPKAQIVFNYLGQVDRGFGKSAWQLATENAGSPMHEAAEQSHEFAVNGSVVAGELVLLVSFSRHRHHAASVQALVDRFKSEIQSLVAHCCQGATGLTPSDVPLARVSQARLDALPAPAANVEDLYPLSPMQSGMLFHVLAEPSTAAYRTQMRVEVHGLDPARFRAAWQATMDAHDVLRTGFLADEDPPLQWVARAVEVPLELLDWRGRPDLAGALDTRAGEALSADLDLRQPPLMQLLLIRTGEQSHHLIWTSHHLLLDGWSASRVMGEVLRRYAGLPMPSLVGRYRDHIRLLQARDPQAGERFWKDQLARLEGPCLLAQAWPRPSAGSAAGHKEPAGLAGIAHHIERLSPEATRRLAEAARAQRVTVNTLVQGAWALLLGRYTGQRVAVFGSTVSGRPPELPGAEDIVGLFINTLAQVVPLPAAQPVGDWLRSIQADSVAAREHDQTPLYEVQRWAAEGGQALFDSLVVFENYPIDAALRQAAPGGLRFEQLHNQDDANYPMTLSVFLDDALTLDFGHERTLFDADRVAALARRFADLLGRLVSEPNRPLGRVAVAGADDLPVLQAWSQGDELPGGVDAFAHQCLARHAARRPEAVALVFEEQQFTYRELNRRVEQLAAHLRRSGVSSGDRVGIAVRRSPAMIVAVLAALVAGGAYVPLDPDYPIVRLAAMMEDSGVSLVLSQAEVSERLPQAGGVRVLLLDDLGDALSPTAAPNTSRHDEGRAAAPLHGEQLAYLIYTSGSTGTPKGVGISHRALVHQARVASQYFELAETDRVLQFATVNFDGFVEQVFAPLMAGAAMVLRGPELWDSSTFLRRVHQHGITVADLSTAYWMLLMQDFARLGVRDYGPLRRMHASGEAMPQEGLRAWAAAGLQGLRLVNAYGPTEATVTATVLDCSDALPHPPTGVGPVAIGTPLPGRRLYVVDADLNLVPPGGAGELCIGGSQLAQGYWQRASHTAERFVADPFTSAGGRLYRTGDLVRWSAAGQLEYLGRVDHQVKIRGFRVELGEIEAQLLAQPEVREAVVITDQEGGEARLLAYVSLQPSKDWTAAAAGEAGTEAEAGATVGAGIESVSDARGHSQEATLINGATLRAQLAQRLPAYSLPALITVLPSLPINANGKVDRHALPRPETPRSSAGDAPQGPLETLLAGLWCEVLGLSSVTRQAHFFELGGHSLLAVRLVTKLRQALAIEVALRAIFDHPTLGELARWLAGQGAAPPLGTERLAGDHEPDGEQGRPVRTSGQSSGEGSEEGSGQNSGQGAGRAPSALSLSTRTSRLAALLDDLETED